MSEFNLLHGDDDGGGGGDGCSGDGSGVASDHDCLN